MLRFPHLLALPLLLLLSACASARTPWVELGGERFQIEIADDDAERARGLMFRDELAAGHGMLFIHDRQEPLAYWMKTPGSRSTSSISTAGAGWWRSSATCRRARPATAARPTRATGRRAMCWNSMRARRRG
jgi:hypothetical protein